MDSSFFKCEIFNDHSINYQGYWVLIRDASKWFIGPIEESALALQQRIYPMFAKPQQGNRTREIDNLITQCATRGTTVMYIPPQVNKYIKSFQFLERLKTDPLSVVILRYTYSHQFISRVRCISPLLVGLPVRFLPANCTYLRY